MSHTRSIATDLAKLLGESSSPVYALDEDRQIVFCNLACARWLGIRASELLGQKCDYHSSTEGPRGLAAARALCPPPECFSGKNHAATVCRVAADGKATYRRAHFFALADGSDESAPVLAILDPEDCASDAGESKSTIDTTLHEHIRRFRLAATRRFRLDSLIGNSPAIVRARAQVQLAAESRVNVLIIGPPGSGKQHAAKVIHYAASEPGTLVPLACAVLEPNLVRATLRAFWARNVQSGTMLVTDADLMPAEVQADMAEIFRSGSWHMRVVTTSVAPLAELAAKGQFSHELACALDTITIHLPPLSERPGDVPLLAQTFLEEINAQGGKQVGGVTAEALDRLAAYPWPRNVDELIAHMREAHEHAQKGEVTLADLPHPLRLAFQAAAHPARQDEMIELEAFLTKVERELIERALRRAKGNKSRAARLLGLTRPRLYRRLVQLGMEQPLGTFEPFDEPETQDGQAPN